MSIRRTGKIPDDPSGNYVLSDTAVLSQHLYRGAGLGTDSMLDALCEFDEMGILRATQVPPILAWMTATHIDLLVAVYQCGEEGMARGRTQRFEESRADALRMLELRDFLHWERNRIGRRAFLCLTWKGQEAARLLLTVARNERRVSPENSGMRSPTCSS